MASLPEPVMYFVVNKTLNMSKGKIAGQVGHAVQKLMVLHLAQPDDLFRWWHERSSAKVVLGADEDTLITLAKKYPKDTVQVVDEGRTQIAPGSLTVIGFRVMPSGANMDLAGLKLL